ncbi:hypothetical protein K458DRAFT_415504 [Lentithecium fluviatile CBS 122367]|uniref:Uncharacterized protein n=1 Tax=Lentithecium fluviatile CBS 122367 TaxID=1168545 RepID=A0A6G1JAJ7_9PLEO|nr:hypothetical protein K458DRAFT_415504 [Lentithecium fluviatile CBS 122367]
MIGSQQLYIDEMVRRTNLMVQFVNSQIRPAGRYCQVQPKMCPDSKFPPEFRVPKTVEEIRAMDRTLRLGIGSSVVTNEPAASSVDRLLRAYHLPADLRSLRMSSQDIINPRTAHQAKLCTLFDFLGATQISERQRVKRAVCLPY